MTTKDRTKLAAIADRIGMILLGLMAFGIPAMFIIWACIRDTLALH